MSQQIIRDVGESLVELLRSELVGLVNSPQQIALTSPVNAEQQQIRLTVFLYSVTPTAELRNAPAIRVAPGQERRPPLPLDLYYLMTAFAPDTIHDPTDRTLEADRLLGAAMQVFYDNGMLSGGLLRGVIPRDTELRLTLQPITVEDLTRIWSVFPDQVYRASVSYLVTPARIDSRVVVSGQRVVMKQVDLDRIVPHTSVTG
jgi:hypothetical protein